MPLPQAPNNSKQAINKQVSANIDELYHHGSKPRKMNQIIAIAEATARGRNNKHKTGMSKGMGVSSKMKD